MRFVGPYKIVARKGEVAYQLELPEVLSNVHDVFHVSQLKKCHPEMVETPLRDTIPLEEIQLGDDLIYEEKPIKILEIAERFTRTKTIKLWKVQWNHHTEEEATWEREEDLKGVRFVTSQILLLGICNSFLCISYFLPNFSFQKFHFSNPS
jgi:hypothetical protein